jgi:hypothetical protein
MARGIKQKTTSLEHQNNAWKMASERQTRSGEQQRSFMAGNIGSDDEERLESIELAGEGGTEWAIEQQTTVRAFQDDGIEDQQQHKSDRELSTIRSDHSKPEPGRQNNSNKTDYKLYRTNNKLVPDKSTSAPDNTVDRYQLELPGTRNSTAGH